MLQIQLLWSLVIAFACALCNVGAEHFHAHGKVNVVANTVGPFNNPTETYPYYSLPFCESPGKHRRHKQNFAESLSGAHHVTSPYELTFLDAVPWRALCEEFLTTADIKEFRDAIEDDYFFEMFIDDLPMWGYIGEVSHEDFLLGKEIQGARVYLYPHLIFSIGFNGDQIVSANVTTDPSRKIDITNPTEGLEVTFSYTVEWVYQPHIEYEDRMNRYVDSTFLPSTFEIHWLSIVNSAVLVFLLTAFLAIILMRILKNDFSKFVNVDEEDLTEEESGWKMIHGDVFRSPGMLSLLCAAVGAGAHIFATVFVVLVMVLSGAASATKRGALLTTAIVVYAAFGIIGGFVSGWLYKQMKGQHWAWNAILTALLFPLPLSTVFTYVNLVAWSHNSTAALPTTVIAMICAIMVCICFPLTIVGASVGRNLPGDYRPPCRTNKVPREIPQVQEWYKRPFAQIFMAGFLPFSAIYIELHYIFAAMWGHKIYTLFGILFMAFMMLTLVASFITVALTYFQLAREDYRWWWQAFVNGGATGLFILGYSFFYLFHRSNMDGLLQLSFYFGYTGLVSYAFFLMLGFIGFFSSFYFVDYIYGAVKTD